MYSNLRLAAKFLSYWFHSANAKGHGIHSPFVYNLVHHVLNSAEEPAEVRQIESLRDKLLKDKTVISVTDMGAGSRQIRKQQRTLAQITSTAVKGRRYNRLLFNLVRHYGLKNGIELGTSMGISTAYITSAPSVKKFITLEGDPAVADVARKNFDSLQLNAIVLQTGNFDDLLKPALKDLQCVDFLFIDGNHREEPTLKYFEWAYPFMNQDLSLIVFDDIHWSREMESAWNKIMQDARVMLTADLFFTGLVFFSKDRFKEKQHFTLKY